jgi:hydroxymethylpyrimidine/phosphomethylpyrimidine kinase
VTPPVALSIAGSDSGGCAGVQADLRTFAALGVFGTSAITSVTAQNTREVRVVHPLPARLVRQQVEAVVDDLPVAGAKCGLLATAEIVWEVVALVPRLPPLVVDPVLVASSGDLLAEVATVRAYLDHLLPVCAIATPNLHEAGALLGEPVTTLEDARRAARRLGELAHVVVVKGGHLAGEESVDVIWDGEGCWELHRPMVRTPNTHGSGCTFSAAIAANLALGLPPRDAIEQANAFVHRAIVNGSQWRLGSGHGPLDHFGWEERPRREAQPG